MLPKQVRNQIVRRALTDEGFDPRLFELLNIDPKAEARGEVITDYPELDDLTEDDEVYRGTVPFELQVAVLGVAHVFDCRAVYSATLIDDGSLYALVTDVLGECEVEYQRLTWSPKERFGQTASFEPGIEWVPLGPNVLIPPEIHQLIRGLIEADALEQQKIER